MAHSTLTLDFGTSGLKAALYNNGTVTATAHAAYPTYGTEQDPRDWLRALKQVTAQLTLFDAVSLTGQMQDLICLDTDYQPLRRAVLYSDARATEEAAAVHHAVPDWDHLAGNEQSATAAQFLRFAPASTTHLAFGPAGFMSAHLGLGTHTDPTTASTTGLVDTHATYLEPVLTAAGIDPALLPPIAHGLLGYAAANDLGIPAGTPIISALGDAAATTLGTSPDGYLYLGTTGWYAQVLERRPQWPGAFHTLVLPGGKVLAIAAVLSAGAAAQWGRAVFLAGASPSTADSLLAQRGRKPTGITCVPSLSGERFPVRDDGATASFSGVRAHHSAIDLYASVLEGVARSLAHAVPREGGVLPVSGGGAASRPWLQILADVTGRTVAAVPSGGQDAALRGAAVAAHETLGLEPLLPLELGEEVTPMR